MFKFSGCSKAQAITQKLPDSRFTASSTYSAWYYPKYARFNSDAGWCPRYKKLPKEYLQIYLYVEHAVCGVATKGHATESGDWTTKYRLALTLDGSKWQTYQENGTAKVSG